MKLTIPGRKEKFKTISKYIKKNSYLDSEDGGIPLLYSTRKNGDMSEEQHGEEDYKHAVSLKKALEGNFDNICIEVEVADEWVSLSVGFR